MQKWKSTVCTFCWKTAKAMKRTNQKMKNSKTKTIFPFQKKKKFRQKSFNAKMVSTYQIQFVKMHVTYVLNVGLLFCERNSKKANPIFRNTLFHTKTTKYKFLSLRHYFLHRCKTSQLAIFPPTQKPF